MSKQSRGVSTAPKQSDGDRSPSLSSSNSSNGWFDLDKRHCCCCVRLPEGAVLVGLYGLSVHAGLLVTQVAHGRADWLWAPAVIQWEEEGGRTGEGGGRGGLVEVVGAITIVGHVVGILVNAMLGKKSTIPTTSVGSIDYSTWVRLVIDGATCQCIHPVSLLPILFLTLLFVADVSVVVNSVLIAQKDLSSCTELNESSFVLLVAVFGTCTSRRVFMLPWLVAQGFLAAAFAALALYYVSFFPQSECLRQEGPKSRYVLLAWPFWFPL